MLEILDPVKNAAKQRLPLLLVPPYGKKAAQFEAMCTNLPADGLGFHATTSAYKDSIMEKGLNAAFAPAKMRDETYFCYLDPKEDPIRAITNGREKTVSTYHRLYNTLADLIRSYGILGHHRLHVEETSPMVVVFEFRRSQLVWNNLSGQPTLNQDQCRIADLRNKAYLTGNQTAIASSVLPIGATDNITKEAIKGMYSVNQGEKANHFASRVIENLVCQFTLLT